MTSKGSSTSTVNTVNPILQLNLNKYTEVKQEVVICIFMRYQCKQQKEENDEEIIILTIVHFKYTMKVRLTWQGAWNRYASPKAVLKQNIKSRFGCSGIGCIMAPSTIIKCLGAASTLRPSLDSQG